jgi:spoIIIJ-associated protein
VEWVETTGRSIEDAKEAALDRLGVDEPDAEFEIVEEAKAGLFGRVRREARVRARIRPTRPRAKDDRRDRRRRRGGNNKGRNGGGGGNGRSKAGRGRDTVEAGPGSTPERSTAGERTAPDAGDGGARSAERSGSSGNKNRRRRGGRGRGRSTAGAGTPAGGRSPSDQDDKRIESARDAASVTEPDQGGKDMTSEVSLEEQGEMVQDFLDGLVDAFELDGELRSEEVDEEMIEVQIVGDDLGLLIGPKGQTLIAVQELARTVVQRRAEGNPRGRFRIDVGGYRQRRREALERFTQTVADEVKASGVQKALEPMNASDRKVVHDTVNEIDGVETTSEGEEPRRRVVILPAS